MRNNHQQDLELNYKDLLQLFLHHTVCQMNEPNLNKILEDETLYVTIASFGVRYFLSSEVSENLYPSGTSYWLNMVTQRVISRMFKYMVKSKGKIKTFKDQYGVNYYFYNYNFKKMLVDYGVMSAENQMINPRRIVT